MKIPTCIVASLILMTPMAFSAQSKNQESEPTAWGMLTHNASCVIFAEGHKTSGHFYGIAITTKTVGKLTLIETQNYTFDQEVVLETQDNMNDLMRMAAKDHIKFVKIPEKYSPELLDKARASCKSDAK